MENETSFDLCVIGSGPAGFAAVMQALDLGKRVCLVEKADIGGAGVLWGALSSKTMWELSNDFSTAARVDRGFRSGNLHAVFSQVRDTVLQAARERQLQMLSQIESFHPSRSANGSVILLRGLARFTGEKSLEVVDKSGQIINVQAQHFLVCCGSKPRSFPGIAMDGKRIIDTNGILSLQDFPKRLLIVGAGIIGCEYATIFSNWGHTEVHLLDHASRILPFEDPDISEYISLNLKNNGVRIYHHARLRQLREFPDYLEAVVDFDQGHSQVLQIDTVLLAIGRIPATEGLDLHRAGVSLSSRGNIVIDSENRATPYISAAGDVAGLSHLANVGEMEGRYCVQNLYEEKVKPLSYANMSTIMFFKPEVAAVGINEQEAQQKGVAYRLAYFSNQLLPRALSMRSTGGFIKILVSDDGKGRILGMRAAGPQASSLIMSISLLMDQDLGIEDYLKTVHPHPCMTESIQECLRLLTGKSLFKPHVFPQELRVEKWAPDVCATSPMPVAGA